MKPLYSGEANKPFWREVANIQGKRQHDLVYIAGCALQEHENRVLQMLKEARQFDKTKKK